MVKKFFFLMFATFLFACSDDIEFVNDNNQIVKSDIELEYTRSYDSALKIAEQVVFGKQQSTRSAMPVVKNHYMYSPTLSTRSNSNDPQVLFHIINFEDNKGFAMISADKRTTPVYAYSDSGNLNLTDKPTGTGMDVFLSAAAVHYRAQIRDTSKFVLKPIDPGLIYGDVAYAATQEIDGVLCKVTQHRDSTCVGDYLKFKWRQGKPYNYYFRKLLKKDSTYHNGGRAAVGCSSVALGQIMAYHKKPASYNGKTYDWKDMTDRSYYLASETSGAALKVAELLHDIAFAGNAIEGVSTSMTVSGALQVLNKFGYSYSVSEFLPENIYLSLGRKCPVYICGDTFEGSGHSWIVDECEKIEERTNYHRPDPPYTIFKSSVSTSYFYHCNWGWGYTGMDGYYLNVFEAPNGKFFNYNMVIVYNIYQ